jgi:hypothetical protein
MSESPWATSISMSCNRCNNPSRTSDVLYSHKFQIKEKKERDENRKKIEAALREEENEMHNNGKHGAANFKIEILTLDLRTGFPEHRLHGWQMRSSVQRQLVAACLGTH